MNVAACAAVARSVLVLEIKRYQEHLKKSNMFIQKLLYTQQSHLILAASFLNFRNVACIVGGKRELHSYTKNAGSLPGKSTSQIKDRMKDDQKKGTFQLATCTLTSPNPPPSSFQLNLVLRCLRTIPNIPALLLFPCETVSLCGRPPGILIRRAGYQRRAHAEPHRPRGYSEEGAEPQLWHWMHRDTTEIPVPWLLKTGWHRTAKWKALCFPEEELPEGLLLR